ncbi:mitochondrial amino-acid acetyltransferase [Hysterangium stoloniferum]|nr:mitochondrial amino-acid acetyltransferase [Hysterangium stoloniferum]
MISCKNAANLKILTNSLSRNPQHVYRAPLATVRGSHRLDGDEVESERGANDFILSILRSNPSIRDTKSYLASFGPRPAAPQPKPVQVPALQLPDVTSMPTVKPTVEAPSLIISSILDPVYRRTALVKIQGPFTDRQLESVATGMVYLEKLGLVSVVVVDHDDWVKGEAGERARVVEEVIRVTAALERQGAKARPLLEPIVRLGPESHPNSPPDIDPPEAHALAQDLIPIRSALRAGEIPVLTPVAMDTFLRSMRIDSNDVIAALVRGMVNFESHKSPSTDTSDSEFDLTPLRLMIINREGGIPSYARSGYPHLLINLDSEYSYIRDTFYEPWQGSHPTALANLALARKCLSYMPPTSSAVVVSHRSPKSLIANLITNKPIVSSSLPHALLQGNRKLNAHTPTLLRRGLPISVVKRVSEIDRPKMKILLEQSFNRTLNEDDFYKRLEQHLDFVIVAGDYIGAAIVTKEYACSKRISYLDKFAVLPSHQGDGTVDFLWVALHDESYGLGLPSSVNPHGGNEGQGEGQDLVWRSRADNPVNKWYFERSSGHLRLGKWVLFWCDAEARLRAVAEGRAAAVAGTGRRRECTSYVEPDERGRLGMWAQAVLRIPSSWV